MTTFQIVKNEFPRIAQGLERRFLEAGAEAAQEIAEGAAGRSRVDTGAMAAGWRAERLEFGNPIPWTRFNESGTRFITAQPMLGPAVEAEVSVLERKMAAVFR
jgi:hypothetical protein